MGINKKYSYNGYNPKDPAIIRKKAFLKKQLLDRYLNRKEYSEACTAMKRGFKGQSFLLTDAEEFNESEVVGSSFIQKEPYTDVFPPYLTKVIFQDCNLDNCVIPDGATVVGGTNQHYKSQNDGEDWLVDQSLNPVRPLKEARFDRCKLSKLPRDIPKEMVDEPITTTNDPQKIEIDKIDSLAKDRARLKQVLIDSGELPEGVL